jgi:hypothetical protein
MTAASVLKNHADTLSEYEQSEILEYSQIYFTGGSATKIRASPHAGTDNHGTVSRPLPRRQIRHHCSPVHGSIPVPQRACVVTGCALATERTSCFSAKEKFGISERRGPAPYLHPLQPGAAHK